jgi:uncharacterized protein
MSFSTRVIIFFLASCVLAGSFSARAAQTPSGPSFNCARAQTDIQRTICADEKLSALDRELADTFNALKGQPGTDAVALQKEEMHWLASERNKCSSNDCIAQAYTSRIAALRDRSLHAASPAAYDETRPFPISPATWKQAQSLVGTSCHRDSSGALTLAGFIRDLVMPLQVVFPQGSVVVVKKDMDRLAFYIDTGKDGKSCTIKDVIALPRKGPADKLLFCSISEQESSGIGVRLQGQKHVAGYWQVILPDGKLERQPLGVLGAAGSLDCSEPETGE